MAAEAPEPKVLAMLLADRAHLGPATREQVTGSGLGGSTWSPFTLASRPQSGVPVLHRRWLGRSSTSLPRSSPCATGRVRPAGSPVV
jgi:hypothetical protein